MSDNGWNVVWAGLVALVDGVSAYYIMTYWSESQKQALLEVISQTLKCIGSGNGKPQLP